MKDVDDVVEPSLEILNSCFRIVKEENFSRNFLLRRIETTPLDLVYMDYFHQAQ